MLALTCSLMERASVTPDDAGCQTLIGERLTALGFELEPMRHGHVDNLWALRDRGGPLLVFAGHTDVVPPGSLERWSSDPFTPSIRDGYLYGRGSADMKGSLAAMVIATERYLERHGARSGFSIGFLLTSDEEGDAVDGTVRVVDTLAERGPRIDYCIIGEPSSDQRLGDVIRIGRRGSLNGRLLVHGHQGHVAYPDAAENPIHLAADALKVLTAEHWDAGNVDFPPTSLQFSNIHAGTGATNVIPAELIADFNLRFSTEQTSSGLMQRVARLLTAQGLTHELSWAVSGEPFLTPKGRLLEAADQVISTRLGYRPEHSTGGGTSDGRFLARLGCELMELGPVNASIHKIDERVAVADLSVLAELYQGLLETLLDPDA